MTSVGVRGGEVLMACGGTEIEFSKINLGYVLCEKEKKRTAPLPATAVIPFRFKSLSWRYNSHTGTSFLVMKFC